MKSNRVVVVVGWGREVKLVTMYLCTVGQGVENQFFLIGSNWSQRWHKTVYRMCHTSISVNGNQFSSIITLRLRYNNFLSEMNPIQMWGEPRKTSRNISSVPAHGKIDIITLALKLI